MGAKRVSALRLPPTLSANRGLIFGIATTIVFFTVGSSWLHDLASPWMAVGFLAWLVMAILGSAFSVVRHADFLAHRLGEPYGTLVLTLSVTGMEVTMITSIMVTGPDNPTLARDTMFAVVMIVLGGLVGGALLIGGLRHRLQEFNIEGANAFLSLIVPLSVLGLVMPNFTTATRGATFSTLEACAVAGVCVAAYGLFLAIQTMRHREFFAQEILPQAEHKSESAKLWPHVALLLVSLVPVVLLAEQLATVLEFGIREMAMPHGVAGLVVAGLILAPEGLGGILAAARNQLQRSINLLLGSALATISLTIPAVLMVGVLTHREVVLGLNLDDAVLLGIILSLCVMTFSRGRTTILQGAIHLLMFLIWLVLIVEA